MARQNQKQQPAGSNELFLATGLAPFYSATLAPFVPAFTSMPVGGALTSAEVRKVDKAGKRITLKHEEIKSLDMPPMTMVFRVRDPAMLDRVKLGDKVMFSAENADGAYTLTTLEIAQ